MNIDNNLKEIEQLLDAASKLMNPDNKRKEIEQLIDAALKSAKEQDSLSALRYSQAACNAANAMITLINAENSIK